MRGLFFIYFVCFYATNVHRPTVTLFQLVGKEVRTVLLLQQRLPATKVKRNSAIAEGPRDASCQLKSCQLPRNSAETTYTTSPDQIDGMKLEI